MLDVNGARLTGLVTTNGKHGARVVWNDRNLYVLRSPTDVVVFSDVDEPTRWGGGFQVRVGSKMLMIQKPGCNCKKSKELAAMTFEQILAAASVGAE